MVELNFVTLTRPESELFEGVLGKFPVAGASPTDDFVETFEFALAVRDGLLVVAVVLSEDFNGLDAGFLPDECSAKEWCIVENVYHERRLLVDWQT